MRNLLKQIFGFIGISGIGWLLDFFIYVMLGFVSTNLIMNNSISSWVGVTFVFVFATRNIFSNESKIPLKYKYFIYLGYQFVLIFVVSNLLDVMNEFILYSISVELIIEYSAIFTKILITPLTMNLNFLMMKYIIEKI